MPQLKILCRNSDFCQLRLFCFYPIAPIFKVQECKKSLIKIFYIIVTPVLRSCKLCFSFRFHHQNTLPPNPTPKVLYTHASDPPLLEHKVIIIIIIIIINHNSIDRTCSTCEKIKTDFSFIFAFFKTVTIHPLRVFLNSDFIWTV